MTGTTSGGVAKMPGVTNDVLLGELRGGLSGLEKLLTEERSNARQSRTIIHGKLDELNVRLTVVERSAAAVSTKVQALEELSGRVKEMTLKAQGAGWLGQKLVSLGGWIIGAAVALYQFKDWLLSLFRAG